MPHFMRRVTLASIGLTTLTLIGFAIQPTAAQDTPLATSITASPTASPTLVISPTNTPITTATMSATDQAVVDQAIADQVAAMVGQLTLAQKVGQLFMVSADGQGLTTDAQRLLDKTVPGGVALFDANGTTPAAVTDTVNEWQHHATAIGAQIPLLVSTDQEGGPVTRLVNGFSTFPAGPALAAMPPNDAQTVGQVVGAELSAVGINMDLAPVTDVQTIPDNPIMNGRSMGSDPNRVGHAAAAFNSGLLTSGVIGILKHFPGHGDASDSHAALPSVNDSRARVESVELQSFRVAIDSGAEAVMVGHLVYPALDSVPGRAASVSPVIMGDILRGELSFRGVIMTDALDMGAITQDYSSATAAVLAITAGADMVTTGPHLTVDQEIAMVDSVISAAQNGGIPMSRIDAAVTAVLTLKARHHLLTWQPLTITAVGSRLMLDAHRTLLKPTFADAVTLARNTNNLIPVVPNNGTLIVYPVAFSAIPAVCATHDPGATFMAYDPAPSDSNFTLLRQKAAAAHTVIIFTHDAYHRLTEQNIVADSPAARTIVVAAQNPYDLLKLPAVAGYLLSYTPALDSFDAVCNVLYGSIQPTGVLPVTLGSDLPAGTPSLPTILAYAKP